MPRRYAQNQGTGARVQALREKRTGAGCERARATPIAGPSMLPEANGACRVVPAKESSDAHHYAWELERINEQLIRANRELEEFAYVASHDLREPLRMVSIYTELLIRQCGPVATDETRQFAKHIQYSVARMEQLIQDVLQYSQVIH